MQKRIALLTALLLLAARGFAQDTNWFSSPVFGALSSSNLVYTTFGTYDETDGSLGGGAAIAYKINDFVMPVFRVDEIKGKRFVPSGSLQLQVPFSVFHGRATLTPFVYSGLTTLNGNAIVIFGTGGAVGFQSSDKWYVPRGLIVEYERWTGGGFDDKLWHIGPYWKF